MKNESLTQNAPDYLVNTVAYNPEKFQVKIMMEKEKAKVMLFAFTQGQELKTHIAPVDVLLSILEGEALFTLGQSTSVVKVGDLIRIPANEPHSLSATSHFKMLLIK